MKSSDPIPSHKSVWRRFWPYIVFSLVIVIVIVVVIVVVVTKNKKDTSDADKKKPPPGNKELTAKRTLKEDAVVDIPVESHPILSEIYDLFVEEVRGSKLALEDASKRMAQPNQKKMAAEAKLPLANKEFYTKVEDFLTTNNERPFEKEGMGGNEDWIDRFGKYVRRNATSPRFERMTHLINMLCGHKGKDMQNSKGSLGGYFWYPKGGCREWHTNKNDALMYRGYFVFVEEEGKSGLNCMVGGPNGKMIKSLDRNGILRLFKVTGDPNPLWHSVWSDTNRFSLGFRLSDRCAEGLKKLVK